MKYTKWRKDSWKLWIPIYGIFYGTLYNIGHNISYNKWNKYDSIRFIFAVLYHVCTFTIPIMYHITHSH